MRTREDGAADARHLLVLSAGVLLAATLLFGNAVRLDAPTTPIPQDPGPGPCDPIVVDLGGEVPPGDQIPIDPGLGYTAQNTVVAESLGVAYSLTPSASIIAKTQISGPNMGATSTFTVPVASADSLALSGDDTRLVVVTLGETSSLLTFVDTATDQVKP